MKVIKDSTSDALQLLNKALKNAIAIAVAPMAHSWTSEIFNWWMGQNSVFF